jgi:hypothetical protein
VWRLARLARLAFAAPLLLLVATACASPGDSVQIRFASVDGAATRVEVSGLSTREAEALAEFGSLDERWKPLLTITAEGADVAAAGRYRVVEGRIEFTPAFPLDPGRAYRVVFDPTRLPDPRGGLPVSTTLSLPARPAPPAVSVTGVYPSSDLWPSNSLRFYVHFSGPMSRESGAGRVHLLDDKGREDKTAILPSPLDFWSPDQTRYTVFFEPGRVKLGIAPNLEYGRALVTGRTYTILIDATWPDAAGRPLTGEYRKEFRVGPARERALSLDDWRVSIPAAGSRDTLVVTAPAFLDSALFTRTVGVMTGGQPLDGSVEVTAAETEWRFTPTVPWQRTTHELVVLSSLEDSAGNRIGRAFEVLPTDPAANAEVPERYTLPIRLR